MVAITSTYSSDVAFTGTVKAIQARKGSRAAYARMEESSSWEQAITDELKTEIEAQTSAFLATASADGQPYIQHRGGPAGFLHELAQGLTPLPGASTYGAKGPARGHEIPARYPGATPAADTGNPMVPTR